MTGESVVALQTSPTDRWTVDICSSTEAWRLESPRAGEVNVYLTPLLAYRWYQSTFATVFDGLPKGGYRLLLTAVNPDTGDVGVVEREVSAR